MNGPREELIELLTAHFDRTRGISDDSAEEAREIADLIMASKWPYRQGDLTGTDVADRLGVGLSTINGWRKRYADSSDPFPQPDESAHSRPRWRAHRWPSIQAWYRRHLTKNAHARGKISEGHVSSSAICVWLREPGYWVSKVRAGKIEIHAPFPEPDKEIYVGATSLPVWANARRPEIMDWYATYQTWAQSKKT